MTHAAIANSCRSAVAKFQDKNKRHDIIDNELWPDYTFIYLFVATNAPIAIFFHRQEISNIWKDI